MMPAALRSSLKAWTPPAVLTAYRRARGLDRPPLIPGPFNLPSATLAELFPQVADISVAMTPSQIRQHLWGTPEHELLVLGSLSACIQPQNTFEFGTYVGASTLLFAMNSPADAITYTLDLPPNPQSDFSPGQLFANRAERSKINQIYVSSDPNLLTPYFGKMDLVFVDADHSFEAVTRDTEAALKMIRPDGFIIWHDYRWDANSPECIGVTHCVDNFEKQHGHTYQIANTRFAVYQRSLRPQLRNNPSGGGASN